MNERKRLNRLTRVLEFYQQQLEQKKARLLRSQQRRQQQEQIVDAANRDITRAEQALALTPPSISSYQQGAGWLARLQERLEAEGASLAHAREMVQQDREAVRAQLSRIESMEKLLRRKAAVIETDQQQRAQVTADDRYLGTTHGRVQG